MGELSRVQMRTPVPQGSLARNAVYKLLSNIAKFLFALATGVMTARWLGPYDKGTLSTLLFAAHVILFYLCGLGLGDALIVLVGRRDFSIQRGVSAAVGLLVPACGIGLCALWVLGVVADWSAITLPVVMAGIGFVFWVFLNFFFAVLNAEERFLLTSVMTTVVFGTTTLFTWIFVGVMGYGLDGATSAAAVGVAIGLASALVVLLRDGIKLLPRWDKQFGTAALRLGAGMAGSFLLIAISQRFDQLVVYAIAGPAPAGHYSIALTVGQLVGFVPSAMASVAFPRIAKLTGDEAVPVTERLARSGFTIALICGIPLVLSIPVLIPAVWGSEYAPGVAPAQILVAGGTAWSLQWLLARAASARGRTGALLWSFGTNFLVMLTLDLMLIPRYGIVGAAAASTAGSVAGLVLCVHDFVRQGNRASSLVPTIADVRQLARSVQDLWRR